MAKTTTYKPEYCEMLIKHMGQGFSYETFGADIGCGRQTMYDWEKVHEDWAAAKKEAQERAQKFFEQRLILKISGQQIKGVNSRDIDTSCLIFALKTRFHKTYAEKTEQIVRTESVEEYLKRIATEENPS